jgi:hypothetical protein
VMSLGPREFDALSVLGLALAVPVAGTVHGHFGDQAVADGRADRAANSTSAALASSSRALYGGKVQRSDEAAWLREQGRQVAHAFGIGELDLTAGEAQRP